MLGPPPLLPIWQQIRDPRGRHCHRNCLMMLQPRCLAADPPRPAFPTTTAVSKNHRRSGSLPGHLYRSRKINLFPKSRSQNLNLWSSLELKVFALFAWFFSHQTSVIFPRTKSKSTTYHEIDNNIFLSQQIRNIHLSPVIRTRPLPEKTWCPPKRRPHEKRCPNLLLLQFVTFF
jgi:hypothetical protein